MNGQYISTLLSSYNANAVLTDGELLDLRDGLEQIVAFCSGQHLGPLMLSYQMDIGSIERMLVARRTV